MQRLYFSAPLGANVRISDDAMIHQMIRVLRVRVGESFVFFSDAWAGEYTLQEIGKKDLVFAQTAELSVPKESRTITLFQAIPNKMEKVEYLVQKGVEVGISEFVFFRAERSQALPLLEKKLDRIREISKEALEQSGGFQLPQIRIIEQSPSITGIPTAILHTALDPRSKTLSHFVRETNKNPHIAILVGPEGGFSSGEFEGYIAVGAIPVQLGNRILRTETAGVVTAFTVARISEELS